MSKTLYADLEFSGTAGFYPRVLTSSTEPGAGIGDTQIDDEEMCFWIDSKDSTLYLCYNQSGTVKTVALT